MELADLHGAAQIHQLAFSRQQHSYEWLRCNFNAAPRCLSYVAIVSDHVVGYIMWMQKSGFRSEVVLELEQLAVKPECQGQGIGRQLIIESLPLVKQQLLKNNSRLKHVLVTTRADNFAQKLYKQTLGAEVEATIVNLYSADEVLMIARNVSI
jgi:ribosomal protein S18 acetylase RimI-like enzyme